MGPEEAQTAPSSHTDLPWAWSWGPSHTVPYLPPRPPAWLPPPGGLHALATLPRVMWGAGPV